MCTDPGKETGEWRGSVVRRLAGLILTVVLALSAGAGAEPQWKQDTEGQRMLQDFVIRANDALLAFGEQEVNSLFEEYSGFAVFGITDQQDAEVPEGVELTCLMGADTLYSLEVRVSNTDRFPGIAAAFLMATDSALTMEAALKEPQNRAQKAKQNPENSFEEKVDDLNGTYTRVYYGYFPDQYHDGINWLQMTVIFPQKAYWEGAGLETEDSGERLPSLPDDADPEYEGYFSDDDYSHYEVFSTATPEPDSAAKEYDSVWK